MQSQMHYKRQEINVNILEKYLTDKIYNKTSKKKTYMVTDRNTTFLLLLFPSAYTAAFALNYILPRLVREMVSVSSFVTVLMESSVVIRLFSEDSSVSFACAFGTLGDAVHAGYVWCCKKLKKKKKPVALSQMISTRLSVCKF